MGFFVPAIRVCYNFIYFAGDNVPKIKSSAAVNSATVSVTEMTVALPFHATGDFITVVYKSATSSAIIDQKAGTTGWTRVFTQGNGSSGRTMALFWKFAGASEPNPTFEDTSLTAARSEYIVTAFTGAHAAPIITHSITFSLLNTHWDIPTLDTTGFSDSMIVFASGGVSVLRQLSMPPEVNYYASTSLSTHCLTAGWFYQPVGGVIPAIEVLKGRVSNDWVNNLVYAIRDDGTGEITGQITPSLSPINRIQSMINSHVSSANHTALITTLDNADNPTGSATVFKSLSEQQGNPFNNLDQLPYTMFVTSNADQVNLSGGQFYDASQDLTNSIVSIRQATRGSESVLPWSQGGRYFALVSGAAAGAKVWKFEAADTELRVKAGNFPYIVDTSLPAFEEHGTFDITDVTAWSVGLRRGTDSTSHIYAEIQVLETMELTYGSPQNPCSFADGARQALTAALKTVVAQGGQAKSQFYVCQSISIGNGGTDATYWDSANQSVEFPAKYDVDTRFVHHQIDTASLFCKVNTGVGDHPGIGATLFNMGDFHQWILDTAVAALSEGAVVLGATVILTNNAGAALGGVIFGSCLTIPVFDLTGGCTITNSADDEAIIVTSEAEFDDLANCTFTGNNRAIQITGNQTGTWSDPNFTVSGNTFDIEYTGTTNFSIQSAVTLTVNNASSGVLTIVTPVLTLNINSDTAATDIRYFEDDSQTVVDSTTGTTLAYNFPDTDVIDIELVKQSYVPVNRQDVTPFDGDFDIIMDFDESYNSGHGLTITSQYDYVRATKVLTINSDQNALDVRSSLADVIRTNSSYFNTPLLMMSIPGLTRVDLTDGMTITSMATWKGAGMEMFDAADSLNPLEKWFSLKSGGFITGSTTHFRQTDSGNSTAVTLTNNVVDEAFQYFDDPNHDGSTADGFDFSDYMVTKAFLAGSKQARSDLLVDAGISSIASNSFQIVLANADHGYSGSDPGITGDLTLVTGGTFGGKTFAYEIIDGGVNTGADIADQFNFNAASNPNTVIPGGTGLRYFELNDMVIHNATAVETERGFQEGTTPTLVGFYASRASADHPGFTRFQADDGTYFTPAVTSNISITGMPAAGNEIRLQIYNVTAQTADPWADTTVYTEGDKVLRSTGLGTEQTAGLYFVATTGGTSGGSEPSWDTTVGNTTADNTVTWTTFAILFTDADPVGTGFADSYTDGEEFVGGDTFRVRFAELDTTTSFKTFETTGVVSSSGFAVVVDAIADSVYASNGIDGSSTAVTDIYTVNYAANTIVFDMNLDFTNPKSFSFVSFEQTTSQGMFQIWRVASAIDAGNYENDVDVLGILFDETAGFVKQEDSDTSRWFRSDGARPFKDPTTGGSGISMNWKNPVFTISTGSVLTELEKSQLETSANESTEANTKIGTPAADVSADIATRMPTTHIDATAGKVDGVALVDLTTENTDMRGNDNANEIAPDNATIATIDAKLDVVDNNVDAIKLKTDPLTFTKANELDSNIQSVNGTGIDGDGETGTEWGPE